MLRFVGRNHAVLERIERNLPMLTAAFLMIEVISGNIQPVHMARLEGEEEIFLTETQSLLEHFNDVPMVIRLKSFSKPTPKWLSSYTRPRVLGCVRLRQRKCGICFVALVALRCIALRQTLL